MRISGRIAPASLRFNADRSQATFLLQGEKSALKIQCQGLLPDNLTEDMDVVVEGTLENGVCLSGDKVITRCASKYQAAEDGSQATAASGADRANR
jgi:cytochrome c-type biogenesis protein CcmE